MNLFPFSLFLDSPNFNWSSSSALSQVVSGTSPDLLSLLFVYSIGSGLAFLEGVCLLSSSLNHVFYSSYRLSSDRKRTLYLIARIAGLFSIDSGPVARPDISCALSASGHACPSALTNGQCASLPCHCDSLTCILMSPSCRLPHCVLPIDCVI